MGFSSLVSPDGNKIVVVPAAAAAASTRNIIHTHNGTHTVL
jgi:hypothetical protein